MHTCQIMLIEADSAKDALDYAKSTITYAETAYPAWSDWHGGIAEDDLAGRWSGLFEGWEETRNVLCYAENPILAEDVIKDFLDNRIAEMKQLRWSLTEVKDFSLDKAVEDYDPYTLDFKDSMNLYRYQVLVKLLNNDWCSSTGVYDLQDHTAHLEYFRKRVTENPEKQFLVPIDFHF